MKATVYIAATIDGFIAREDGALDWLPANGGPESDDYGFQDFFNSVDALLMGRNTYEMVLSFGQWAFGDKPVVVLPSQKPDIPEYLSESVSIMSGNPNEIVQRLAGRGYDH